MLRASQLIAAPLLIACGSADAASDAPPVDLAVPLERSTLENGMEVAVVPNHAMPAVTALVAFRAGAFVEDPSHNGLSHLFEHMIFTGSQDVPDAIEFRRRLDALGAQNNATTNIDVVTYFFTVGTPGLDEAMGLFAGSLKNPALADTELEQEKQVVLGEFDLNEGDYDFVRYRRMLEELFGDYESRVEPLGSRSVVTAATSTELRAAHDEYYVPNNALLVFSGDIDAKEAHALAQMHFGDWPKAPDPIAENPPPRPRPLEASSYVVLPAPIADTRISIGWMCPGTRDDDPADTVAGRVLAAVTTQSDHSFRSLVTPGLANSARFVFTPTQYASYVTAEIIMAQGREAAVLRTAKAVLGVIGMPSDVTRTQLGIAKDQLWTSFFYAAEDPGSLPHAIAAQWSLANVDAYETFMDDVYGVDRSDLDRFAAGCVRGHPHAVVLQSSPDNLSFMGIDENFLEERL